METSLTQKTTVFDVTIWSLMYSIGIGKMMVELCSAAILNIIDIISGWININSEVTVKKLVLI